MFVGVELIPVDAPTRGLFKLPAVGGLLVVGVAPDSPAAGKLGQGDILLKLDDQTLVNREQLRALIRSRKPGDPAVFTVARGGREESVKLVLAEAKAFAAPVESFPDVFAPEGGERARDIFRDMRERTRRALRDAGHPEALLDGADDVVVVTPKAPAAGESSASVSSSSSRVIIRAEGSVTIIVRDGKKFVTVKDKDGRTLADGELDDALRAKLPEWAKPEVDRDPVSSRKPLASLPGVPNPGA